MYWYFHTLFSTKGVFICLILLSQCSYNLLTTFGGSYIYHVELEIIRTSDDALAIQAI